MAYNTAVANMPSAPCPPPGLEDALTPAKIPTPATLAEHRGARIAPRLPQTAPENSPQCHTQGEWVTAVMAVTPYLDAEGVQKALNILDAAVSNIQRAKALDLIVATSIGLDDTLAPVLGPVSTNMAAEVVRAQIYGEQQQLLQQLHQLRVEAIASLAQTFRGPHVVGGGCAGGVDHVKQGAAQHRSVDVGFHGPARVSFDTSTDRAHGALGHPGAGLGAAMAGAPFARACPPHLQKTCGDRPGRGQGRQVQTLSTSLQTLAGEDPDCLIVVRRINKLGFKACRKLKQHFLYYGAVVKVLVAHSTVRDQGELQTNARRRPSSLGFVHMAHPESVRRILAQGAEHEVEGALIRVQRFERQAADPLGEEPLDGEEDDLAYEADMSAKSNDWARQQSNFSTVSTRTSASMAPSLGEADALLLESAGTWSF